MYSQSPIHAMSLLHWHKQTNKAQYTKHCTASYHTQCTQLSGSHSLSLQHRQNCQGDQSTCTVNDVGATHAGPHILRKCQTIHHQCTRTAAHNYLVCAQALHHILAALLKQTRCCTLSPQERNSPLRLWLLIQEAADPGGYLIQQLPQHTPVQRHSTR